MTSPLIIMVGADKGGVGKTHVCRAVRDYMEIPALKAFPRPRLLDGQFPRGDMVQFCPGTEVINITDISDQMKVFDTLSGVTIVDIPAGLLGYTLKACDDARLLDDVRSGTLRMALLHVLGPSISSLDEIAEATHLLGTSAKHFIVKNHINETNFFEWDKDSSYARSLRALADITISVSHLDSVSNEAVQQSKSPYVDFVASQASRTLRGRVAKWLERTCAEFDRVGLGRLIAETFVEKAPEQPEASL